MNAQAIQKRDAEATRTSILDAAEQEFLRSGFAEASTAQIARAAGVTKSLIHHHFGSKEKLWSEVKERRFAAYGAQQMELFENTEPSLELLEASVEAYFRFVQHTPEMVRLICLIHAEPDCECSESHQELTEMGVAAIRHSQDKGELRADLDPRVVLFSFIALAEHWFSAKPQWAPKFLEMGQETESELDEAFLRDMKKIFFEGVLPR